MVLPISYRGSNQHHLLSRDPWKDVWPSCHSLLHRDASSSCPTVCLKQETSQPVIPKLPGHRSKNRNNFKHYKRHKTDQNENLRKHLHRKNQQN